jgi:hypothetical protein
MHRIALKSRVRLEAPRLQALFSSQYLCGSSRPDTSHVIHEISIQDVQGNWIRVKALIDCGATSIFASPRLIELLGLESQQAHTTTYGLDGNIMSHARDSRKTRLSVSYFEHEQPVDESDVLIVPMTAYDLVLGLPWFKTRNPEIDWEAGKLLSLQRRQPNNTAKRYHQPKPGRTYRHCRPRLSRTYVLWMKSQTHLASHWANA